jgi:hypothetical protein
MTLSAQKLKMRRAHKSDAAAVYAKLKAMSKLIAIYLYLFANDACNWASCLLHASVKILTC